MNMKLFYPLLHPLIYGMINDTIFQFDSQKRVARGEIKNSIWSILIKDIQMVIYKLF